MKYRIYRIQWTPDKDSLRRVVVVVVVLAVVRSFVLEPKYSRCRCFKYEKEFRRNTLAEHRISIMLLVR